MRVKLGIICMLLGMTLMGGALCLFLGNQSEARAAEQSVVRVMPKLREEIDRKETDGTEPATYAQPLETPVEYLDAAAFEMTEVEIEGDIYIGYISVPVLELELPVIAQWDYASLKTAPCRYAGSVRGGDLVIMAHNYPRHFGGISSLAEGDRIIFTDMDGVITAYEVVAQDVLSPYAVEEMTSGEFDLTLFTCTYGGENRVAVYCNRSR